MRRAVAEEEQMRACPVGVRVRAVLEIQGVRI